MKHLLLFSLISLAACNSTVLNTGQEITVNLVGTDGAYCILSTDNNRYALDAPGTAFIERDAQSLKIDCDDNQSDRRRAVHIKSDFGLGYWNYPSEVTIDFANFDNGTRFNGYRADVASSPTAIIVQRDRSTPPVITEILTENSYSRPLHTSQDYPVKKEYYMGRRSYPITP